MTLASRLDARKEVSGRSCIAKCMPTARRAARVEITELVDFGNFRASTMHALVWQWTDRVSGVSLSPLG